MKPPEGLAIVPGQVCKLEKSLYGLKQASRQWNFKLKFVLLELGYNQCKSDYSMFTKSQSTGFTVILVYVDDLVLAGDDLFKIERVKQTLHDRFRIKDIGDLKFFLGLEVARSSKGIALYQRKNVLDLLRDTGFKHCKPASTPMDYGAKLSKDDGDSLPDSSDYRKIIGKLLYLSNTGPDISFAIGKLSQFLDCPTPNHLQAAHRILRYIKNSPAAGLFFSANSDLSLTGFFYFDWAGCPNSRRSVLAYCFYVGSSLVTWKIKKQVTVAVSSSEVEYQALALATREAQWLSYVLKDLGAFLSKPVNLYCDSKSAIYLATNSVFHERTKHIEADCHIVRDKLQEGLIHLLPISTHEQVTDIMTKPLAPGPFNTLCSKLGLLDIFMPNPPILREGIT
ncbi:uncharacterized protein LOC107619899 [Arachis ipaensis]|uniref:uncharacterized protein LOC107619899 n=1 Tax=Arachis ipaensis TaxID=130454 RepID=UPI0007AF9E2E|nr:uncharacterized protein LOC107619899 [Arachis ipaensis]